MRFYPAVSHSWHSGFGPSLYSVQFSPKKKSCGSIGSILRLDEGLGFFTKIYIPSFNKFYRKATLSLHFL